MPKTLPASTPAAALGAPCDPVRTAYGQGADGIVFRCDVNSAETAYVWSDEHH